MPFGKIEEHCRIAAGGNDPPGRRVRLEPDLSEVAPPRIAPDPFDRGSCLFRYRDRAPLARRAIVRIGRRLAGSWCNSRPPSESAARSSQISPCGIGKSQKEIAEISGSRRLPVCGFQSPTSLAVTSDVCNGSIESAILERFQAKWIPVRVKKTRQTKN
jgi:hypothetical protein